MNIDIETDETDKHFIWLYAWICLPMSASLSLLLNSDFTTFLGFMTLYIPLTWVVVIYSEGKNQGSTGYSYSDSEK